MVKMDDGLGLERETREGDEMEYVGWIVLVALCLEVNLKRLEESQEYIRDEEPFNRD